ncbi:MAG TPA: HAMP domain-containing sensor histidine kinase [Polyangiaceae bacterium]
MTARANKPWLFMAVLAVLSLGLTVYVAQRALTDASDIVVRGEGDVLMVSLTRELSDAEAPPTSAQLETLLTTHGESGLRYLAVVDRAGRALAQAGAAQLGNEMPRPGESIVFGRRVRVTAPLFPPRGPLRGSPHPPPEGPRRVRMLRGPGLGLLVVEFEPPVIEKLRGDLTRISVVAAVAGAVLLAFAVAWSRSAARLAAVERKAAREQRLVALGSMASVMAHELRNPLTSLKGHAQLLVEDLEEPKQRAKAERVVREAERIESLTTSLLDFVRDGPIERAAVTPRELVSRALEHLAAKRVNLDLAAAPERLFVDEARLARALHNLIDNALQATSGAEAIELGVAHDGADVLIDVRDHGAGIPAGAEAQIFEPFYTTRVRGTGLGLAVARRIAEQHDGSLTGENHPDGGALFRLRFPNTSP